ncbi:2,3-bisphosphoglycerate-independent phosphoglycerate mutase [Patescibacteria group bacterium]|nr:2,3-bisphosphoglycerate-independent phosphoglycerate mutase [Patescibacteria group bacterium]
MTHKAIILAAGLGSRLKPLTEEVPKCLTEVNGEPILEHNLKILEKNNITEVVIVIGYLGDVVKKITGNRLGRLNISYITNDSYDRTNTMYSVWLAKEFLLQGTLLIEGDSIFDEKLITMLLNTPDSVSYWAADQFTEKFNGSMSIADTSGRIKEIRIVHGKLRNYKNNYYKSTGALKITAAYGKKFYQWLNDEVKKKNVNIYYDLVLAKNLKHAPIKVCNVHTKARWYEIDNLADLRTAEKIFRPKKYIIIIIDGAADLPVKKLDNKTPLEYARTPHLDKLTRNGRTGLMRTVFPGLPIGSIVANLGIMGYNPLRYYPNGRASFEALAQDILLDDDDIAFRCNLLSLTDGSLKDFTADNITDKDARNIFNNLKFKDNTFEIYPGQSYRNLVIVRNAKFSANEIESSEPHHNIGKPYKDLLLKGKSPSSKKQAVILNKMMIDSIAQIKKINTKYKTPADMLFIWSPSSTPKLSSFHKKFNIDGAIVGAMDFMKGIGIAASMEMKKTLGATGYSNTNLSEKLKDTKRHLKYNDLVYLHINAPDEESHNKNVKGKVAILERIDKEIIGPLKKFLDEEFTEKYSMAVMPDHYTLVKDGTHGDKPVPYVIYGEGVQTDTIKHYSEREIAKKSKTLMNSYEFMDFFLQTNRNMFTK